MGIIFRDGPAVDVELEPQRAPMFLRVVVDERAPPKANGRPRKAAIDCLDLLTDKPREFERIEVYELVGGGCAPMHSCGAGGCRIHVRGLYGHRPDVDGEPFRETDRWRAWCAAEGAERGGAIALSRRQRTRSRRPALGGGAIVAFPARFTPQGPVRGPSTAA